jgi:hypothetical protein
MRILSLLPGTASISFRPLATATLSALALAACTTDDVERDGEDPAAAEAELDDETLEIVENLKQAGFPEEGIEIDEEGLVIVGGDAVVTIEASREMIGLTRNGDEPEDGEDQFRQYRTTNVVAHEIDNICINGSALNTYVNLSAGLDGAIANYTNQNLTFDMTRINGPSGPGCDVVITVNTWAGSTSAQAGFPAGGLPFRTVWMGTGIESFGIPVATHVLTHELGHAVGFRHSDYYNRGISGCSGGNEGQSTVGAHHIPNTPTTAVYDGSIMNACYNVGSTGVWDAEDIDALHQLYGRDCCSSGSGAGCGNVPVNECVGAVDPYCNNTFWDGICVAEVTSLGCGTCPAPVEHSCCSTGGAGCSDNVIEAAVCAAAGHDGTGAVDPYCCNVAWDGLCVAGVNNLADNVALPCGSSCCSAHGTAGCDTPSVQSCVGAVDSYCITTAWDSLCVAEVETLGCSRCA